MIAFQMTLASKCREVMQEAALYKRQLARQRNAMADLQRQQDSSPPTVEFKKGTERIPDVSPVLVSSDDFEEHTRGFSTSVESEEAPASSLTPLLTSPKEQPFPEPSPPPESPLVQATVNPHRFFPQSASPKNIKTGYNEEFPGDITAAAPSRRVNFQRMGSFEELECEDDIELETNVSPPKDGSRYRDASGVEKKEKSQGAFSMSSLDAFEASFQTDIARSFSSTDIAPTSDEIYDPFSNSPVKINISAATPIIEKPYEAEPPAPTARGAFGSDPPGVDKTSTRPNGPLHKEVRDEEKPMVKPVSPSRPKPVPLQYASLDISSKKTEAMLPNRVQAAPALKVPPPVLSEQSKNDSNRVSLAQQVLTVQSKAALLLSVDEDRKEVQSKVVSTRESTLESLKSDEFVAKVNTKDVSPRGSPKRDKQTVMEQRKDISTLESSKVDEQAVTEQTKTFSSIGITLESPKVDKDVLGSASKPPRVDNQAILKEEQAVIPLETTSEAVPVNQKLTVNQKGRSEPSRATSLSAEKLVVSTSDNVSSAAPVAPSATTEKSPKRARKKATLAAAIEKSPTTEKIMVDKAPASNSSPEKPPTFDKTTGATSMIPSPPISHASPNPSAQRHARVTPSPGLAQLPKSVKSVQGGVEPEKPRPVTASTRVDDQIVDQSSKTGSPASAVVAPSAKARETYSTNLFASQVATPEKNYMVNTPHSPSWVKSRSYIQDGPVQRSPLKTNGGASIFPKTSPSFQAPKLIEEPTFNGNDSSSSTRSRESSYRGSSSPFRKTFGEVRPAWAQSSTNEVKTVSSSTPLTPSASARSWQTSSGDSRPSWAHDNNSSRFDSGDTSKLVALENRSWQTGGSKLSLSQEDRLSSDNSNAASLSSINNNSYTGHSPVQAFKPSMSIKALAAAFESRTPNRSYVTYSDASTPSDEELGEIPMVSPPRVEEVRKSLNSRFGQ